MEETRRVSVMISFESDRPMRLLRNRTVWQEVMDDKFAGKNEVVRVIASAESSAKKGKK